MFEKATRMKIRFDTSRGRLSTEDVWDLPLVGEELCLDNLAKALNKELKDDSQESFVIPEAEPNEELQLKLDLVKRIIGVRLAEREAAENALKARQKKQQILQIIAEKEAETLKDSSLEELRILLESL